MNAPLRPAAPPGKRAAIALAVAVHLILAAILIYGVHWQTKVQDVVEVELVQAPPVPAPVAEPPPPAPEPKIEPPAETKPLPPPPKPDIVIKEKKKEAPKPMPKEPAKPMLNPFQQNLAEEEKRLAQHKLIAAEESLIRQQRDAQAAAARSKAIAAYGDRIRARIRSRIVLPPDIKGNPVARFEVVQLPSGEVMSVKLTKPSGHAGYDAAVERAIHGASPLPKPDDPALFERILNLTFCPQEEGCR